MVSTGSRFDLLQVFVDATQCCKRPCAHVDLLRRRHARFASLLLPAWRPGVAPRAAGRALQASGSDYGGRSVPVGYTFVGNGRCMGCEACNSAGEDDGDRSIVSSALCVSMLAMFAAA